MTDININKLKAELAEFTGTEKYYYNPLFPKFRYTEGVKYLAENAGSYWLLDYIFGNQHIKALQDQPFQVWKISVKENRAIIKVEDGNDNQLRKFKLEFADFPLEQFTLWLIDGVLILPIEY